MSKYDTAGRQIAGLLGYNPGPGIYSRLERAVQQMPENVRVQELPGLLKRYKDGVPGWELKATDLDQVIAGRDVVPREELLARVREASPVYTHKEVVLGGRPQRGREPVETDSGGTSWVHAVERQEAAAPLGQGVSHGEAVYPNYSQGGTDYTEVLLAQPGQSGLGFNSHWAGTGKPQDQAVAHARFDTHGDALRINELQSDLGIHNRKARQASQGAKEPPERLPNETVGAYEERLLAEGFGVEWGRDGEITISRPDLSLPFPLEDAWADLLIKRLALEAARKGHRAIEVASPASVFAKTGNHADEAASMARMEHVYGNVVPGALERLGRKMGGLVDERTPEAATGLAESWKARAGRLNAEVADYEQAALRRPEILGYSDSPSPRLQHRFGKLVDAMEADPRSSAVAAGGEDMLLALQEATGMSANDAARLMPEIMFNAQRAAAAQAAYRIAHHRGIQYGAAQTAPPGRRYIMSDEMRRRIIEQGIGAALMAPIATEPVNGQAR